VFRLLPSCIKRRDRLDVSEVELRKSAPSIQNIAQRLSDNSEPVLRHGQHGKLA